FDVGVFIADTRLLVKNDAGVGETRNLRECGVYDRLLGLGNLREAVRRLAAPITDTVIRRGTRPRIRKTICYRARPFGAVQQSVNLRVICRYGRIGGVVDCVRRRMYRHAAIVSDSVRCGDRVVPKVTEYFAQGAHENPADS